MDKNFIRMRLCCHPLSIIWLTLFWSHSTSLQCPGHCMCRQNEKGKRKLSCTFGTFKDFPSAQINPGTEIMEISSWSIPTIPNVFKTFKFLEELHIHNSSIHSIGTHTFWGVPTLLHLDLVLNNISAIVDHNFRGLVNLVELNLDHNKIVQIQSGVFKHLTELRILTVTNNLLNELVPRMFLKLGKLHVLKLSENKFEELDPESFKDIPELRILECRKCGLKRINTQIYHLLPYLTHLDLGDNRIQFLLNDEFHDLHKLRSLKMDGNQLPVVLENTFVHQQQLRYLCLARNRLAKIPNTAFFNLTSLIELDISYNKLRTIEAIALQHIADTLKILHISGNAFSSSIVKIIIETLHAVTEINLAHMGLSTILGILGDNIMKVNVSNNNITNLTYDSLPKRLTDLDVSSNKIKGLGERTIMKLELLKSANLTNNSWACDLCHITPMLYRVNKTQLLDNLRCAMPPGLQNRTLTSLNFEDITTCKPPVKDSDKPSKSHIPGLAIGATCFLVFLVISIMFVVCSCMRRRARNLIEQEKTERERRLATLTDPVAVFCKEEISFKFQLNLTERQMSVCTIDEIKRDAPQIKREGLGSLSNGSTVAI